VVTASSTENTDLFWALRGAGMSFGIITSFQFRTIAAPEDNVLFYYPYIWSREQAVPGWTAFQDYCAGLTIPQIPVEMNIRVVVGEISGEMLFLFEGVYHGSQDTFLIIIQPLLDALNLIGGLFENLEIVQTFGWLDSLLYANNNDLLGTFGSGEVLETPLNYTVVSSPRIISRINRLIYFLALKFGEPASLHLAQPF
jgi:hypothetical protein